MKAAEAAHRRVLADLSAKGGAYANYISALLQLVLDDWDSRVRGDKGQAKKTVGGAGRAPGSGTNAAGGNDNRFALFEDEMEDEQEADIANDQHIVVASRQGSSSMGSIGVTNGSGGNRSMGGAGTASVVAPARPLPPALAAALAAAAANKQKMAQMKR